MITWKWMPGFLYQTIRMGKRARQQRDRETERVGERQCVAESEG
jgi:hypothetical protein